MSGCNPDSRVRPTGGRFGAANGRIRVVENDSVVHPVFGQLRWEPAYSWWLGEVHFPSGGLAELVIAPGDAGASFLDTAAALYPGVVAAEARIRREAAEGGILDLYRHWRNDDEPELTADE